MPALHWVVIEDAPTRTGLVTRLLNSSGMSFTHLAAHTPPQQKLGAKVKTNLNLIYVCMQKNRRVVIF